MHRASQPPRVVVLPSRSELLADAIKEAILGGTLKPGEQLVERELASSLSVSKTPVREALKLLASSGLVTVIANRGVFVRHVDAEMVRSVFAVRRLLEPAAVQEAGTGHTAASLVRARGLLEQAREAAMRSDRVALELANRRFHRELYAPCGNELLIRILDSLQDQLALISVVAWSKRATWSDETGEHEQILRALEERGASRAAKLLVRHIERFLALHAESIEA